MTHLQNVPHNIYNVTTGYFMKADGSCTLDRSEAREYCNEHVAHAGTLNLPLSWVGIAAGESTDRYSL